MNSASRSVRARRRGPAISSSARVVGAAAHPRLEARTAGVKAMSAKLRAMESLAVGVGFAARRPSAGPARQRARAYAAAFSRCVHQLDLREVDLDARGLAEHVGEDVERDDRDDLDDLAVGQAGGARGVELGGRDFAEVVVERLGEGDRAGGLRVRRGARRFSCISSFDRPAWRPIAVCAETQYWQPLPSATASAMRSCVALSTAKPAGGAVQAEEAFERLGRVRQHADEVGRDAELRLHRIEQVAAAPVAVLGSMTETRAMVDFLSGSVGLGSPATVVPRTGRMVVADSPRSMGLQLQLIAAKSAAIDNARMDKLRAMAAFVRIVDAGSLTAAADALDVSQPSMVRHARRAGGGAGRAADQPHDAPHGAHRRGSRVLRALQAGAGRRSTRPSRACARAAPQPRGRLRITSSVTVRPAHCWRPLVVDFMAAHPAAAVEAGAARPRDRPDRGGHRRRRAARRSCPIRRWSRFRSGTPAASSAPVPPI